MQPGVPQSLTVCLCWSINKSVKWDPCRQQTDLQKQRNFKHFSRAPDTNQLYTEMQLSIFFLLTAVLALAVQGITEEQQTPEEALTVMGDPSSSVVMEEPSSSATNGSTLEDIMQELNLTISLRYSPACHRNSNVLVDIHPTVFIVQITEAKWLHTLCWHIWRWWWWRFQ